MNSLTAEKVYFGDSTRICAATLYDETGSVAVIENVSKWHYNERRMNNADFWRFVRLLSGAPDLRQALEQLCTSLTNGDIEVIKWNAAGNTAWEQAQAALAKISG